MQYDGYLIRYIKEEEIGLLDDFLYESIFQNDPDNPLPRKLIYQPEFIVYIEDYGKRKDDNGLVAEVDGKVVGAVWTRIVNGYGHVDNSTPEFVISLYKEYRNKGIGTNLMKEMLTVLKEKGYKQTSLSAQKANYAVKMYRKVGFQVYEDMKDEYIFMYKFK